jgi:hypothetical protein
VSTHSSVDLSQDDVSLPASARSWFAALLAVGVLGLGAALALAAGSDGGWTRFYASYLVSFVFFLSLALGALFFVLVQHVTRAGWSVAVRRLAEGIAPNVFFPMAFLALPVLYGLRTLYPWTDAAAVAADHLLHAKEPWLNVPFFLGRTVFYFGVWSGLAIWFHRKSTEQDRTGDPRLTQAMEKTSTAALIFFAFTVTFFAFDYLMSLTPHWYSTIFGVYFFAGCVLGFFALMSVLAFLVQRAGALRRAITTEHYHDLGKLVFAFTVFWAYIGFSQYMLMWYANLPEETIWYAARQTGSWTTMSLLLIFGHFLVPFLALMSRDVKRRKPLLLTGAVWMLAMQWADVYWLVMPAKSPGVVPLSFMDLAVFLGVGGLFFAAALRRLGAHALVAVKDPRLSESLGYESY